MKKNDKILMVVVLLIAFAVLAFQLMRPTDGNEKVAVTVDGKVFGTYLLSEDKEVSVNGTNEIVIENGAVLMESADCPDQICVEHKQIKRSGECIICIPNKVVVSIEGGKEELLDEVVQ